MMVIDGYTIDCEIVGEPQYENEATDYPVEKGVDFTDHVRRRPVMLNVEGIVSDSPLGAAALVRQADGVLIDPTTGELGGEGPTRDAYARLLEIHGRSEPITVSCALGTFDNMIMLTFAPKREGGSIRFTGSFKFIRIIENERTLVRVAVPRAAGKDNFRNLPSYLQDERGRDIQRDLVSSGPNKGTSIYHYKDGTPVPDAVVDKATKDAGAVRIKYVNGQAVPVHSEDYQPYVHKRQPIAAGGGTERPFWPDDDVVKGPANKVPFSVPGALPGLGG